MVSAFSQPEYNLARCPGHELQRCIDTPLRYLLGNTAREKICQEGDMIVPGPKIGQVDRRSHVLPCVTQGQNLAHK